MSNKLINVIVLLGVFLFGIWGARMYYQEPEITTETEKLLGTGMTASQDFSSWRITKVTGIITLKN